MRPATAAADRHGCSMLKTRPAAPSATHGLRRTVLDHLRPNRTSMQFVLFRSCSRQSIAEVIDQESWFQKQLSCQSEATKVDATGGAFTQSRIITPQMCFQPDCFVTKNKAAVNSHDCTFVVAEHANLHMVSGGERVGMGGQAQRRQRGASRGPGAAAATVGAQHVLRVAPALRQPPHLRV